MFASPVLTNIKGFSYITVIVSHQWEKSNLVQSHAILNHMWLGQFYDILPILKLPVGLQFNVWAAKRQRHHCFCRRVVFRQESYQWKGLKQLGSTCDSTSPRRSSSHISGCFQKSHLEGLCSSYFQVALQRCRACRSWFSICPKSHPESVAPLVCISGIWSTPWPQKNWIQTKLPTSCVGAMGLEWS